MEDLKFFKFGGLYFNPESMLNSQSFLRKETEGTKIIFVVSALKGMTRLLNLIVKSKLEEEHLSKNEKVFAEIGKRALTTSPKFQFFEGRDGVQHVLKDLLLYRNVETKAYWPIKAMIEILSENFLIDLNKERIKRNIYTKAIWPENQKTCSW